VTGLPGSLKPPNPTLTIRCTNCGANYSVYPPTSEYTSTMPDPCPRVDYQKSFFDCVDCNKRNTFYWHKMHRDDAGANPV
jgi:hypothetical protein